MNSISLDTVVYAWYSWHLVWRRSLLYSHGGPGVRYVVHSSHELEVILSLLNAWLIDIPPSYPVSIALIFKLVN